VREGAPAPLSSVVPALCPAVPQPPAALRSRRMRSIMPAPRKGGRAVECDGLEILKRQKSRFPSRPQFFGFPERFSAWLSGIRRDARSAWDAPRDRWKPPETALSALGLARVWRENGGVG
jgi:hypothetical protein